MSPSASPILDARPIDHDPFSDHPTPPDKISAYYSLVFPNFTYYLQTLSVTIGRRCLPPAAAASSTLSSEPSSQVDVDLGPLKSVSRLHAKIEYEEQDERFVLVVIGRNGAWVDGVWSGSGCKVPLSERSQIQIASRSFQFILPPPPVPEDSPSPSSHSSANNRPRSPSLDITSISPPSSMPSHSPPPATRPPTLPEIPPLMLKPDPEYLPEHDSPNPKTNPKKRKKTDKGKEKAKSTTKDKAPVAPRPKPEDMPPKPPFTYAQLIYRAIKATQGKATLQDIVKWIMRNYDWYRYNEGEGWESSVRHNLSSGRAFVKGERCGGERGKGFFWSVDPAFEHIFEEQETKQSGSGPAGARKGKGGASLLEPPLKRSVKGLNAGPLPPPLTSTPLVRSSNTSTSASAPPPPPSASTHPAGHLDVKQEEGTAGLSTSGVSGSSIPALPTSVRVPIIIGPAPPIASTSTLPNPQHPHLPTQPITLANNTLILNPAIFAHLTREQLRELEALGAQKALEILQGYIVRYLKEKMRSGRGRGRRRGGAGAGGGSGRGASVAGGAGRGVNEGGGVSGPPDANAAREEVGTVGPGVHLGIDPAAPPSTTGAVSAVGLGADGSAGPAEEEPIIVVDDSDDSVSKEHGTKRRRVEGVPESGCLI